MVNLWQIQLRGRVLVEEDILECVRLRKLNWRADGAYRRHVPKVCGPLQSVADSRPVAHAEAAILEECVFIALPVLENRSKGKPDAPVIAGDFRYSIAAAGHKSRIVEG